MRYSGPKFLLAVSVPLMFTACAAVGAPPPPSLECPKPPSDCRAARKGDRVTLSWTAPSATTDRRTLRSVGPTRICRALARELTQCGIPVGDAAAQPSSNTARSSKQRIGRSYVDSLPGQLQSDNPSAFVTYAVEVLNAEGRGAG